MSRSPLPLDARRRVCGVAMLLCGTLALAAARTPGTLDSPAGVLERWRFPAMFTVWALALIVAGLAMVIAPRWVPFATAAAGGLLAAFIAGESFVGLRDWFNVAGAAGINLSSLADVVTLAAASCVAATVAVAVVMVVTWPEVRASRRQPPLVLLAALVAAGTPILLIGVHGETFTATAIGARLLSPSLPCAGAVALAGLCRRDTRLALLGSVVVALAADVALSLV
ncbi:hypothetical protein AB0H43_13890 [Hamadaea sp. NPDC050747]|uniref:hypothetical protein n=1 Tax=Hamadaea sp. NPDC050747 TaxID=3155789 RepID=UPI0033F2608B